MPRTRVAGVYQRSEARSSDASSYSQPLARAIRAASMRFAAPSFRIEFAPLLRAQMFLVITFLDAIAMISVGIGLFFAFANPT